MAAIHPSPLWQAGDCANFTSASQWYQWHWVTQPDNNYDIKGHSDCTYINMLIQSSGVVLKRVP